MIPTLPLLMQEVAQDKLMVGAPLQVGDALIYDSRTVNFIGHVVWCSQQPAENPREMSSLFSQN